MCCALWEKKVSICRLTEITLGEDYSVKGTDILGKKPILQRKLMKNKYVELICNRHFKKSQCLVKIIGKSTLVILPLLLNVFTPHLIVIFEIMA